ncbi:hypothetical protein AVEN_201270-1, partial [Araneus ventricosus]
MSRKSTWSDGYPHLLDIQPSTPQRSTSDRFFILTTGLGVKRSLMLSLTLSR